MAGTVLSHLEATEGPCTTAGSFSFKGHLWDFLKRPSPQSFRLVLLTSENSVSPSAVCLPLPAESLGSWQAGSSLLGSYSSQVVQASLIGILVQLLLWGRHLAPKKQERRMDAWMVRM